MNTYCSHILGFLVAPVFVRSVMKDRDLPSKLPSNITNNGRRNSDYDEEYLAKHKDKIYFSR